MPSRMPLTHESVAKMRWADGLEERPLAVDPFVEEGRIRAAGPILGFEPPLGDPQEGRGQAVGIVGEEPVGGQALGADGIEGEVERRVDDDHGATSIGGRFGLTGHVVGAGSSSGCTRHSRS